MSRVIFSTHARVRVTFPESAKGPAEEALRGCFENRTLPTNVAKKFFAAHYQVVRVDVLEDGTVRMGKLSSADDPSADGTGESHRRDA
jgi:hypothetical protein